MVQPESAADNGSRLNTRRQPAICTKISWLWPPSHIAAHAVPRRLPAAPKTSDKFNDISRNRR